MIPGTTNTCDSDVSKDIDGLTMLRYESGEHEVRALMREWANIVATAVPLGQKGHKNAQQGALLNLLGKDPRYGGCVRDFRRVGNYVHLLEQYLAQPIEGDDLK